MAEAVNADRKKMLQVIAFAHMLNEYINGYIGKLSAVCTCAVASATAASAAITWLLGGDDEQIGYVIRNMTGNITGMICDGGKVGCALKLSTASGAAFMSALLAINGVGLNYNLLVVRRLQRHVLKILPELEIQVCFRRIR